MNCEKCGALLDESGKCTNCGSADSTVADKQAKKHSHAKKKRRGKKILAVILALIITFSGCTCALVYFEAVYIPGLSPLLNKNIESYSNKDTTYHPTEDTITYDSESNVIYFNNMLTVYTFSDLSRTDAEKLAKSVDGKVVGDISGCVNILQIKVDETTLDELNKKSEILMSDDNVLYAGYDFPISFNNTAGSDPWSDNSENPNSDRGNEKKPNGNDWWAEAIGAYTAWDNAKNTEKIKVGIIDSGFDSDHGDLRDSISFLPNYKKNSETNHGTHVAGLIGAKNNSIGIRGVADSAELICVDWNPSENVSYLSASEYAEIIKQMIEKDVRVINNSWTTNGIMSKYEYTEKCYNNEKKDEYESYLDFMQTRADRLAMEQILLFWELFLNGEEDFLIIQAAGNGYSNGGADEGFDTNLNGAFCCIDEDLYNDMSDLTRKTLEEKGITYKKIKEHILIVGAVKNKRDKNGNYKMRNSSNYGDNVDICAPGEEIYSTLCNNTYGFFSGTSMAAPIVSGAAALLWSCDMSKSAAEIKKELIESCTVKAIGVGDDKGNTYPMLNIGEAIKKQSKTSNTENEASEDFKNLDDTFDFLLESGFLKNFDFKNLSVESVLNMLQVQFGIPTGEFLRLFYKYRNDIEEFIERIMEYFEE